MTFTEMGAAYDAALAWAFALPWWAQILLVIGGVYVFLRLMLQVPWCDCGGVC